MYPMAKLGEYISDIRGTHDGNNQTNYSVDTDFVCNLHVTSCALGMLVMWGVDIFVWIKCK